MTATAITTNRVAFAAFAAHAAHAAHAASAAQPVTCLKEHRQKRIVACRVYAYAAASMSSRVIELWQKVEVA